MRLIVWLQNTEADKTSFLFCWIYQWSCPIQLCNFAPPSGYTDELQNHNISEVECVFWLYLRTFHFLPSSSQVGRNNSWCKKAATRWNVEESGCRKPFADPERGAGIPKEYPQWGLHTSPLHFYFYWAVLVICPTFLLYLWYWFSSSPSLVEFVESVCHCIILIHLNCIWKTQWRYTCLLNLD